MHQTTTYRTHPTRPTTIQERFPAGHPFRKWLPHDGLFEINKAQLDCKEIVDHIPIFLNCLFFNVKTIRNRAEIREKGKTIRDDYYRYLGEIPPRRRTLSTIPAKPERIIDSEIMEPSIASPRRSREEDDMSPRTVGESQPGKEIVKRVIPPRAVEVKDVKDVNSPESAKQLYNALEKEAEKEVPAILINCEDKPKERPQEISVVRIPPVVIPPIAFPKSVSTGRIEDGPAQQSHGDTEKTKLEEPKQTGMKRANSEGVIPTQKKEEEKKEDDVPPVDLEGLFERLAPCDDTMEDGEILRQMAVTPAGDKIKPLLPPSIRKVMEQKAREYNTRPQIRSYSRTIYNMAEIEKWITPQNPRNFYSLSHLLGQGAYGEVYSGHLLDPTDTRKFAIKVTPNLFDRPTKIHDLTNEIRFLEECKHPNIVEHVQSYLWNKEIWTVMEYCNAGNLADVVQDEALTEEEACYVTREILKGVAYLHNCNKIHRDLKGDNILISSGVSIKIADFGLMTEAAEENGRTSICGSRYWMSPEMLKAEGYGTKSDIWSIGCIIYEMLTEGPPYIQYRSLKAIFYTATRGVEALENVDSYSPLMKDFLNCIFQGDPRARLSAEQLLCHPWIKECKMTQAQIMHSLRHLWSSV